MKKITMHCLTVSLADGIEDEGEEEEEEDAVFVVTGEKSFSKASLSHATHDPAVVNCRACSSSRK